MIRSNGLKNWVVTVIKSAAQFTSDENSGSSGGYEIRPRRFVIATGSRAFVPPIDGLNVDVPYFTNETIFQPGRLAAPFDRAGWWTHWLRTCAGVSWVRRRRDADRNGKLCCRRMMRQLVAVVRDRLSDGRHCASRRYGSETPLRRCRKALESR